MAAWSRHHQKECTNVITHTADESGIANHNLKRISLPTSGTEKHKLLQSWGQQGDSNQCATAFALSRGLVRQGVFNILVVDVHSLNKEQLQHRLLFNPDSVILGFIQHLQCVRKIARSFNDGLAFDTLETATNLRNSCCNLLFAV